MIRELAPGDRVVVIGAGPAGLTAGLLLRRAGADVTVFEATDALGGLSQTVQYKEFRFDIGGHRFFTKYPAVEALWRELLNDEFIRVPRLSRIHYRGRFFDYPLRAANALAGLGPIEAVRILASYAAARVHPRSPEETFKDWVSNRFGRRLFDIFFRTYTEKVWGVPCHEIRAEWAAQRIQNLSLWTAVRNALPMQRRGDSVRTLIHEFDYPRLGPGQMWQACAARLVAEGGLVVTGAPVLGVTLDGTKVSRVVTRAPEGEVEWAADHVISTMPLRDLVRCLRPVAPPDVVAAAEGLRYRDFLTVALILDQPRLFPDNWIYIHTPGVKVGRIQNFNNWSPSMVPVPGRTCLGLEYFCFEGDGLWASPDAELIQLATDELDRIGIASGAKVLDATVVRMPKAYPIYDAAYRSHLDVVRGHLSAIPNLQTVGRNGMHKYNNQDHSMLTAMMAVENLRGARHDTWAVNTDYEYHEEQRVNQT